MFEVYVFDEAGRQHRLENVKIGFIGQTEETSTHSTIREPFTALSASYFSLGTDVDYYSKLANDLSSEFRQTYLTAMRDVAHNTAILSIAAEQSVFQTSHLRGVSIPLGIFRPSNHLNVMHFALSENRRIEATPRAAGVCPGCGAEMLARCGTKKVWHWAHKGRRHCDRWWENETQWHRDWKNKFSSDWQEIPARDARGELHIADIKTPEGLTIEFQHSAIKPDEIVKRTAFYDQVIWIIDATRRPTDAKQYAQMLEYSYSERFDGVDIHTVYVEETRLLKEWGSLGRIVGFDYGGDNLFLLTAAQGRRRYLFDFPKLEFVQSIIEGKPLPRVQFGEPVRSRYPRRRRF